MKRVFQLFLISISINIHSQSLPNNFKVGGFAEVMENDSILFYFNCIGTVEDKRCAQYYRKGQIDSININFSRNIIDYYMNGAVALEASIIDNYLNGEAIYYHENGMVKSTGNYNQDIKTGIWTYYYDNGQLEKH